MTLRTSVNRLAFLLALPLLYASLTIANADESMIRVNTEGGPTQLHLTHPKIDVTIRVKKLGGDFPYKNALLWGGDLEEPPPNFVSEIKIKDADLDMFVPLSAYSDLGDVHRASIHKTSRGFKLIIYGGDTATSYEADLEFSDGFLVGRKVSLNAFPDARRETTKYRFPPRTGE